MGHNGGGVALDDGGMGDHGRSGIGRSQGVSVSQSIAMAIGRNQTGIGHGAQGRDEGDLQNKPYIYSISIITRILSILTSLNILGWFLMVAVTS